MRILIVGAGIAGMTLAALLNQRGVQPTVIERMHDFEHGGYMLGLYPLGSRILHGLGLYDEFLAISEELHVYEMRKGRGALVQRYLWQPLNQRYGSFRNLTRPELLTLLREGISDQAIRMGTTVAGLVQVEEEVRVTFSDGATESFDLVVGADGIHSKVRELLFGRVPYRDTNWGGWVWWADAAALPHDTVVEYWGAGRFLGMYPTHHRVGIFGGGPLPPGGHEPVDGRARRLRERFQMLDGPASAALQALPDDDVDMFYWKLSDVRSPRWFEGRVVLIGDAAAGFLPTAGVGASMAMESAAVLSDELSRTDARYVGNAIDLYVKRRRHRVEMVQNDSRKLARGMFLSSTPLLAARDFLMRFYSPEMLAGGIAKSLGEPI